MCTLILLRRPGEAWPLILGANRDEMRDRPSRPPGPHWPERPGVVAGQDLLSGGAWLGLNRAGVVAAILNRRGSLGPQPGLRSRGELVLQALEAGSAEAAAADLAGTDPQAYRSFNLVIADRDAAFWLRHLGPGETEAVETLPLPEGLTILTAGDRNDPSSPRVRRYLPQLEAADLPDPARGDWQAWQALLSDRGDPEAEPMAAMNLDLSGGQPGGFGTVSSSLLALGPKDGPEGPENVWLYADGRPDEAPFEPVILLG